MLSFRNSLTVKAGLAYILTAMLISIPLYVFLIRHVESHVEKNVHQIAEGSANQVFNSMYQIMRRGWERKDLLEFIKSLEISYEKTPIRIELYRSDIVKELYGTVPEPEKEEIHILALKGTQQKRFEGNLYTYVNPIKAEQECLRCHYNAKEGDVLGLVEIRMDVSSLLSSFRGTLQTTIATYVLSLSIFLTALMWIFRRTITSLSFSITRTIEGIQSVGELNLSVPEKSEPYDELKPLYRALEALTKKIKDIAVDKEILKIEANILERFIITSTTIKEWEEYLSSLLKEINKIVKINLFFTLFIENNSIYVKVFWYYKPEDRTKDEVEAYIKSKISLELPVSLLMNKHISFGHSTINSEKSFEDSIDSIKLRTKALFLEKPHIGGVIGLGFESELVEDDTKHVLADTLLSMLVNVVGSSKAISDHIKQVEFYAMRDPLTTLYNQRVF